MEGFTLRDTKTTLWGKELVITAEMQNSCILYQPRGALDAMVDEYKQLLRDNKITLRHFCEKEHSRVVQVAIMPFCPPVVKMLNDIGIYNVDEEIFWQRYYAPKYLEPWEDAYHYIADMYNQMLEKGQAELDLYERKKQSRLKITGGGFGLLGAAKGVLTAELINLMTGTVYDIKNAKKVSNVKEKMKYISENSISHPEIIERLGASLQEALYNILYAAQNIIEERTNYRFLDLSEEKIKDVDATINTFIKMGITDERLENEVIKLLQINPFNERIYHMAIAMHGDEERELDIIANLAGVDLKKIRQGILMNTVSKIIERVPQEEVSVTIVEWAMHLGMTEEDFRELIG